MSSSSSDSESVPHEFKQSSILTSDSTMNGVATGDLELMSPSRREQIAPTREKAISLAMINDYTGQNSSDDENSIYYYEESVDGDYMGDDAKFRGHGDDMETSSLEVHTMTADDLEICKLLDHEYELALEERDIAFNARFDSVRQSACCAVSFMLVFLAVGVTFFTRQAEDWDTADALLFSVYAITTVGYGNLHHPETPAFQLYTIFFILLGIATLTIMVAQVYQCIALEASRAQQNRESADSLGGVITSNLRQHWAPGTPSSTHSNSSDQGVWIAHHHRYTSSRRMSGRTAVFFHLGDILHVPAHWMDRMFLYAERLQVFLRENEIGRGISVLFPFCSLITIGATVVGLIEGWTIVESLYFAVVSLTTVGFGDYYPTQKLSIWFCVIWLPFSIGFMSLYLTNVAAFYIRLSDANILRIERQLRDRLDEAKKKISDDREAARRRALRGQLSSDTFNSTEAVSNEDLFPYGDEHAVEDGDLVHENADIPKPTTDGDIGVVSERERSNHDSDVFCFDSRVNHSGFVSIPGMDSPETKVKTKVRALRKLFGMRGCEENRREQILRASGLTIYDDSSHKSHNVSSMSTMRDVLRAVQVNLDRMKSATAGGGSVEYDSFHLTASEFFSLRSNKTVHDLSLQQNMRKPSFALRVLVQERLAEIIATDVAGFQDSIEIRDHTLSITIDSLRQTADRWKIPRRARRAFRAVAFEVLFFVGEHGLVTRGADALYDLSPIVFHGLFAPLLAALGDAEMMEAWLVRTQVLAEVDLRKPSSDHNHGDTDDALKQRPHRQNFVQRRSAALAKRSKGLHFATVGTAAKGIRKHSPKL